jgi:hypothetical protein
MKSDWQLVIRHLITGASSPSDQERKNKIAKLVIEDGDLEEARELLSF